MAEIIDFSSKITNQLPVVKITEDLVVTVNNRKSVVLSIQAMAKQVEKKAKEEDSDEYDQITFMKKAMAMLIGGKHTEAIEDMDLPMPEYTDLYRSIMDVASGTYGKDTPSK